jgi:uridine kinase
LLFDGVFLLRPALAPFWDYSIFVAVDFQISVPRAVDRDSASDGKPQTKRKIRRRYEQRYLPGQQLYLQEAQPKDRATLILDNNDLEHPFLVLK